MYTQGNSVFKQTTPVQMCPFCPLMVEEALWEPIGVDFFGQPAKIGDIPSCDGCAQVAHMSENGVQDMLDMLKDSQTKEVSHAQEN